MEKAHKEWFLAMIYLNRTQVRYVIYHYPKMWWQEKNLQKTAEMRFHSDLMQVLVFIIIFIVIHIIIIHHTNRSLNVTLKHKIVLDDGPVIQLKSASKAKLKEAAEKEYEEQNWSTDTVLLKEKILSYPHHLKYSPVEDWPSSMDADER